VSKGPAVVFLGPSLEHSEALRLAPNAVLLPPAKMGDVLSAIPRFKPHSIAIIDGSFLSTMSVFHKEILYAIDQGIWVLGSSSMGALRAAECDRYGMIGIGEIYEALRSGAIDNDADVALAHGDEESGFAAVSTAMVTIRATLQALVEEGRVLEAEAAAFCEGQQRRWFPDRSVGEIIGFLQERLVGEDRLSIVRACLRNHSHDPKRSDAIALLRSLDDLPDEPVPVSSRPNVALSPAFQATLARDAFAMTGVGHAVSFEDIRRHAVFTHPRYQEILGAVRREHILCQVSAWLQGEPSEEELSAAGSRLAKVFGVDQDNLHDHLASLDLDAGSLDRWLFRLALVHRLEASWLASIRNGAITAPILNHMRLDGTYGEMRNAASLQQQLAPQSMLPPELSSGSIFQTFAAINHWSVEDLDGWIDEHDLGSRQEVLDTMEIMVRASDALFGTGLVDPLVIESEIPSEVDPSMSRGS